MTTYVLEFNGATSVVDCGSDASLDNLPTAGDFTVDAWIRADGYGGTNLGIVASHQE